MSVNN